jgi:hypothetical protein
VFSGLRTLITLKTSSIPNYQPLTQYTNLVPRACVFFQRDLGLRVRAWLYMLCSIVSSTLITWSWRTIFSSCSSCTSFMPVNFAGSKRFHLNKSLGSTCCSLSTSKGIQETRVYITSCSIPNRFKLCTIYNII